MNKPQFVNVIGSGFAGIECALFLAGHGIKVHLFDDGKTYKEDEVVKYIECNSTQRRKVFEQVLIKELAFLGSPLIRFSSLDYKDYSYDYCSEIIKNGKKLVRENENISIFSTSVHQFNPNEITVIATGNNTDERLVDFLIYYFGYMNCFKKIPVFPKFQDVDLSLFHTIEGNVDRYYLPLDYDEYNAFIDKILEVYEVESQNKYFTLVENTMEWFAIKGRDDLKNYAMMPVYLPNVTKRPYAVLKFKMTDKGLRLDDVCSKFDILSQIEVFTSLKGLNNAKLVKKTDVINSCLLNSKFVINEFNQAVINGNIFFAGSILGIEGAIDSIATGLTTAIHINKYFNDYQMVPLPKETCIGSIAKKIVSSNGIKPQIFLEDYGVISGNLNLHDQDIVDKLFNRSLAKFEEFKEKYKNGKHV